MKELSENEMNNTMLKEHLIDVTEKNLESQKRKEKVWNLEKHMKYSIKPKCIKKWVRQSYLKQT